MNDLSLAEAILFARGRGVVLPSEYYSLDLDTRRYASTVSYLGALDQIQDVLGAVYDVVEQGGTFKDFKDLVAENGYKLSDAHLDNIFRTNTQNLYAHGRWSHQQANKDKRPYLLYMAIEDSRTRPKHLALNMIVRHIDDPFWLLFYPPNGFRCRCTVRAITEAKAKQIGITADDALPSLQVDKGWDFHPAEYADHPANILSMRIDRELDMPMLSPFVTQSTDDFLKAVQLELEIDQQATKKIRDALDVDVGAVDKALHSAVKAKAVDVRPSDLAITLGLAEGDSSIVELVVESAKDEGGIGRRIIQMIKDAFARVFAFAKNTKDKLTGNSIRGLDALNIEKGSVIGLETPTVFIEAKNQARKITILDAKGVAVDLKKIGGEGALISDNVQFEVLSNDDEKGLVLKRTDSKATKYFVANQRIYTVI